MTISVEVNAGSFQTGVGRAEPGWRVQRGEADGGRYSYGIPLRDPTRVRRGGLKPRATADDIDADGRARVGCLGRSHPSWGEGSAAIGRSHSDVEARGYRRITIPPGHPSSSLRFYPLGLRAIVPLRFRVPLISGLNSSVFCGTGQDSCVPVVAVTPNSACFAARIHVFRGQNSCGSTLSLRDRLPGGRTGPPTRERREEHGTGDGNGRRTQRSRSAVGGHGDRHRGSRLSVPARPCAQGRAAVEQHVRSPPGRWPGERSSACIAFDPETAKALPVSRIPGESSQGPGSGAEPETTRTGIVPSLSSAATPVSRGLGSDGALGAICAKVVRRRAEGHGRQEHDGKKKQERHEEYEEHDKQHGTDEGNQHEEHEGRAGATQENVEHRTSIVGDPLSPARRQERPRRMARLLVGNGTGARLRWKRTRVKHRIGVVPSQPVETEGGETCRPQGTSQPQRGPRCSRD